MGHFTSTELVLADTISDDLTIEHRVVCEQCYARLDEMEVLSVDSPSWLASNYQRRTSSEHLSFTSA